MNKGLLPANQAVTVTGSAYVPQLVQIGSYLEASPQNNGVLNPAEAQELCVAIYVPSTMTFDRISYWVNAVAPAGCVARLGIRSQNTGASTLTNPSTLILDAGTDDASITTASLHAITINQQLTTGIYWLTLTIQGAAASRPNLENCSRPAVLPSGASFAQGRSYHGVFSAAGATTGALPVSFTATGLLLDGAMPWLAIRRSA